MLLLLLFCLFNTKSSIIHFWSRADLQLESSSVEDWKEIATQWRGLRVAGRGRCIQNVKAFKISSFDPEIWLGVIELWTFHFSQFYDRDGLCKEREFIKCADLNIWLVSCFMPLPFRPYGMDFSFICLIFVPFRFMRLFLLFSVPFGDLFCRLDGRTHILLFLVEFVVSINWIIWLGHLGVGSCQEGSQREVKCEIELSSKAGENKIFHTLNFKVLFEWRLARHEILFWVEFRPSFVTDWRVYENNIN